MAKKTKNQLHINENNTASGAGQEANQDRPSEILREVVHKLNRLKLREKFQRSIPNPTCCEHYMEFAARQIDWLETEEMMYRIAYSPNFRLVEVSEDSDFFSYCGNLIGRFRFRQLFAKSTIITHASTNDVAARIANAEGKNALLFEFNSCFYFQVLRDNESYID